MSESLASDLLAWYRARGRELPWRRDRDPYRVWVSEIMLQQTQVVTATPYYERFMARFPSVTALAAAPEEQLLKAWEGLGYYARARHLQAAARMIEEHHDGRMPESWEAVRRLPGVGDYTAGAILSIAFDQPVPAVDGNVLRVFSRLRLVSDDVGKPVTKRQITSLVQACLPAEGAGDFNQALMDLGALVCTPTRPDCANCPLSRHCGARATGVQEALPVKAKKQAPKPVTLASVRVERAGRLLLIKRPVEGVWGGLWALPSTELEPGEAAEAPLAALMRGLGLQIEIQPAIQTLSHTLTHRQLTIPVHPGRDLGGELASPEAAWVSAADLARYPMPVPFQRIAAAWDPGPLFRLASYNGGSVPQERSSP